jgi:hypothetical protein
MKHAVLALSALALLAAPALAQEKVKLEVRAKKGEKYTRTSHESNEGTVTVEFGGQSIPQPVSEKESKVVKDEVLEVDGVQPSKIRRTFTEWTQTKVPPGAAEPQKENRTLHGKTIVLKKNGDKTEYEGADGAPASELGQNRLRTESYLANLPKEPVAPGAEWTLDEKLILDEFREGADAESPVTFHAAKGVGRLERIEDHKGQKCGVLLLNLDIEGSVKEQKDVKLKMNMKATIWLGIDSGRPLTLKGEGTGDLAGEIDMDGNKVKLSGKFKFKSDGEQVYE